MSKCICVIRNGERFSHGQCLAFHDIPAVGYVVDPVSLSVQRGPFFGESRNARDEVPILNRLLWDVERSTTGKPLGRAEYTVYNGIVYRCTRGPLGGDQYHASTVRYAFGARLTDIPESSWVSCDAHGRVMQ